MFCIIIYRIFDIEIKTETKMDNSTLSIAKEKIASGAKFNGVVYVQNNNKNNNVIFIYLDGVFFKLEAWVSAKESKEVAKQYEIELAKKEVTQVAETVKMSTPIVKNNEWLVNEKKVVNNLFYGDMWNKYGTDFE